MEAKPAARTVIVVLLSLGALAVALASLLGPTSVVEVETETFDPATLGDTPIVMTKSESGGFDLFGIVFDAPDRRIGVGLVPTPECLRSGEDGTELLDGSGDCERYADLAGPVRGGGTRADGTRFVEMWLYVDRACFESTAVGEPWPAPGCVQ